MKTKTKQTTRTGTESQKWNHIEVYHWEEEGENWGGKVQGIRSIISRHKIDRETLRMVQETEDSKNLNVQPMDID